MRLDDRIEEGSRVLVGRRFEAEVISVAADRLTCQVRPFPKAVPPPLDPNDGKSSEEVADYNTPPLIVPWHEVKLTDIHL